MKIYVLILLILLAIPTLANNTQGYAWSESVGWFDFSNVTITDTAVTGQAYNNNTGWLILHNITNNNGQLSGYAWSESVGWFDFSNTSILNGNITGYAYNNNTGWLSFSTGTNVTTTWSPTTTPTITHTAGGANYGGGSFSYIPSSLKVPTSTPRVNNPTTTPKITLPTKFTRNLNLNSRGNEVKLLQQFLNSRGYTISLTGAGSAGQETTHFGILTRQALARFQATNNIKPSVGLFGPLTRAFINKLTN